MRSRLAAALFVLVQVPACSLEGPREHIVMFDADGRPVEPVGALFGGDGKVLEERLEGLVRPTAWDRYLDDMFQEVERFGKDRSKKRLVIFIHGGLNTRRGAVQRATELIRKMLEDGSYPIFVNWRSSLFSSYRDHLLFVRQGDDWGWLGVPFAPFYFAADAARAVARAPFVWWTEVRRVYRSQPMVETRTQRRARRVSEFLTREYEGASTGGGEGDEHAGAAGGPHGGKAIAVEFQGGERGALAGSLSALSWLLTSPAKIALSPFIDSFGPSSWAIMRRRVELLFHEEEALEAGGKRGHPPSGFLKFLGRMSEFQRAARARGEEWEIVLIGHSMGAIVANEILRHDGLAPAGPPAAGEPWPQYLPMPEFAAIVNMAAACSLRDHEDSVFPYLARHTETRFYHVLLDDRAEELEFNFLDLPPRGSLLVWIDDFLASPATLHDRAAGRFTNLMLEAHQVPEAIQDRVHIKVFGIGKEFEGRAPLRHGEFADHEFWRPAFYDPTLAARPH
jgi:hypothetical protein